MNSFQGNIVDIKTSGNLSLVSVELESQQLIQSIIIETPKTAPYLKNGGTIQVLFKETEVVIATEKLKTISLQNQIAANVSQVDSGELLSKVVLNSELGPLVSVISTRAVEQLNLAAGVSVFAMIKLNEVMLSSK